MTLAGTLLKPFFSVTPADLPPGAAGDAASALRMRQVVFTVTECCSLALLHPRGRSLVPRLDAYPDELRGFAYEGAGVGLAALDHWLPWERRVRRFVAGAGRPYRYAVYLGAGMGLARMRRDPEGCRRRLADDVLSWAVLDGYGFHEGFFAHRRHVQEQAVPPYLSGYGARVFDQGLGRGVWFATGADPGRMTAAVDAFPESRRGDLWAGIGLACGYTGGVGADTVAALRERAVPFGGRLAEGVAVAAWARHQVGNPAEHNETACSLVCGLTSAQTAKVAEEALRGVPGDDVVPAYEVWRRRLRTRFAEPARR
ncbi:DUF1702 family protein [Nocardiopsis suaedae]|uniref:DUF1702 family protein n=1 Tax=Nocardiopsis suaedae TaxID=3018444 RepID=A0ABT4TJC0_9ACTN|nr:DUF1702 family protein [Nocardiopsis suaedae]MDA2804779.1 DUF1702 family protein [Nocardiopsis suaedae]